MRYICTHCEQNYADNSLPFGVCECGKPLAVEYSWKQQPFPRKVDENRNDLWRYGAVLPKFKAEISLGEGWTPLVDLGHNVLVKDETGNPTGSFKDRGMALAISRARQVGIKSLCLPSAGNAGVSAAAYAREAGLSCHVFLPEITPPAYIRDTEASGAATYVKGSSITEAGVNMQTKKKDHWFDLSTLKEPFRVEGKKTLGYEIAEQLGWKLPHIIIYPTGGGTGILGMWKAFKEMLDLGWVKEPLPRFVAVQSDGCAPVVKAFERGRKETEFWKDSRTAAWGLNVPGPLGGYWILQVLKASRGLAVAVKENELDHYTAAFNQRTGLNVSKEGGAVWCAFLDLKLKKWIKKDDRVIILATGQDRK
ncbi:MAG: threonine synthase [Candidatus Neomarinimicrobiota bacterium]